MRVLVLGGTAFIGAEAARALHARGHDVTVFHRGRTNAPLPEGVKRLLGDRNQLPEFLPEFRAARPDVVLDMLCMTERDARDVIGVFTGLVSRVVVASSCDVYRAFGVLSGQETGAVEPVPLSESAKLRTQLYPYRGSRPRPDHHPHRWMDQYEKILVERAMLAASSLQATVLRLPMVYGPGDRQHRMFPYLKRMVDGRPAILLDRRMARWRGCRGFAPDMGLALALCCEKGRPGRVYHVAETEALPERDWIERIGTCLGWKGRVVELDEEQLPTQLQASINPAQDLVLDSALIRRDLGYAETTPRDAALRATVEWERVNFPERFDPMLFDYAEEDRALARTPG